MREILSAIFLCSKSRNYKTETIQINKRISKYQIKNIKIKEIFTMNNNLKLITTEKFGELDCSFYRNMNDDILLTREQIGQALEYKDPTNAIQKIHKRHSNQLNDFSICISDGLGHDIYYYNLDGALTICSLSQKEQAYNFSQWLLHIANTNKEIKIIKTRKEIEFVKLLTDFLDEYDIKYIKQFQYKNYRIDLYLPELLIAVEYDEDNHKYYSDDMEIIREENLKYDLGCNFIRLSDHDSDGRNLAKIINHIHTYMQF